jgi:hypothetical protein
LAPLVGLPVNGGVDDLVPLLASQSLAEHLVRQFPDSSKLYVEAIRRLTGDNSSSNGSASFAAAFAAASHVDTALFVKERQNLFVDDAREARVWSWVLIHLAAPLSLSVASELRDVTVGFARWVAEGLELLTEMAEREKDGPLGWTSKTEVFPLGLRVVYGAEVLLEWGLREVEGRKIMLGLWKLVCNGRETGLHEMWLSSAEKVLEKDVIRRLKRAKEEMPLMVGQ